jgi:hypothetical protein
MSKMWRAFHAGAVSRHAVSNEMPVLRPYSGRALQGPVDVSSNLQRMITSSSGALAPESRASLPMGYGKHDNVQVVCPENDVERKSTKNRAPEITVENLKSVGRIGDQINQPIQLIEKPHCGANTSLGVPGGGFVGILQRCRMEADRPPHQPFNLVRS